MRRKTRKRAAQMMNKLLKRRRRVTRTTPKRTLKRVKILTSKVKTARRKRKR